MSMRWSVFPLVLIVLSPFQQLAEAAEPGELVESGFVFAPLEAKVAIRETPSVDAKVLGSPAGGTRLVYRKAIFVGMEKTWYWVENVGLPKGWVSAKDVIFKRPGTVRDGKPIKLVDTGVSTMKTTSRATAAGSGLDSRAKAYGELENMELTVKQFITLEYAVGEGLGDKADVKGLYDDQVDKTRRKVKADEYKLPAGDM